MPGPWLGYSIVSGPEWERVIAALGRVNDDVPGELGDAIEADAEKLAGVARGRVLGLPTPRQAGHTGLRQKWHRRCPRPDVDAHPQRRDHPPWP
jgi:hypothetical protein